MENDNFVDAKDSPDHGNMFHGQGEPTVFNFTVTSNAQVLALGNQVLLSPNVDVMDKKEWLARLLRMIPNGMEVRTFVLINGSWFEAVTCGLCLSCHPGKRQMDDSKSVFEPGAVVFEAGLACVANVKWSARDNAFLAKLICLSAEVNVPKDLREECVPLTKAYLQKMQRGLNKRGGATLCVELTFKDSQGKPALIGHSAPFHVLSSRSPKRAITADGTEGPPLKKFKENDAPPVELVLELPQPPLLLSLPLCSLSSSQLLDIANLAKKCRPEEFARICEPRVEPLPIPFMPTLTSDKDDLDWNTNEQDSFLPNDDFVDAMDSLDHGKMFHGQGEPTVFDFTVTSRCNEDFVSLVLLPFDASE
jgi:hypothetical protein